MDGAGLCSARLGAAGFEEDGDSETRLADGGRVEAASRVLISGMAHAFGRDGGDRGGRWAMPRVADGHGRGRERGGRFRIRNIWRFGTVGHANRPPSLPPAGKKNHQLSFHFFSFNLLTLMQGNW